MKEEDASSGSLSVSSKYLSLFPNFIIGTYYPGQLGVYLNTPVEPGITYQNRIIYTTEGKAMSEQEVNLQNKIWWSVHKEDHEICDRLQLGRFSPISKDGGLLSPYWENRVRAFQKIVIKSIKNSKNKKK